MAEKSKTKVKKMKMAIEITPEVREQLLALLNGQCDVIFLNDVYFRHLYIEDIKYGGHKVHDLKLKRGRIKSLKMKSVHQQSRED
jgi:hypothetical protein